MQHSHFSNYSSIESFPEICLSSCFHICMKYLVINSNCKNKHFYTKEDRRPLCYNMYSVSYKIFKPLAKTSKALSPLMIDICGQFHYSIALFLLLFSFVLLTYTDTHTYPVFLKAHVISSHVCSFIRKNTVLEGNRD